MTTLIQRTHDQLYLKENRYDEPKEIFKFISEIAFANNNLKVNGTLCDFGCAAGEFLYYLKKILPNYSLTGIDILPSLLEKAEQFVPSAIFKEGSVLDVNLCLGDQYDKSFLIGVHSIFDEFETCFSNLIRWTKPGGSVYISGMFNPFPVDVLIKYKESENYEKSIYESGWNIFSQQSVSEFLKKNDRVKSFTFSKFNINIDLPRQDDPIRSWTLRDVRGDRFIVNGLCLLQPHYLLEVNLK